MSKITISNTNLDSLRDSLGAARLVTEDEIGEAVLSFGGNKKFKVEFLSKDIVSDGDYYAEKCKIAIKPNVASTSFVNDAIGSINVGIEYLDHFAALPSVTRKSTALEKNKTRNPSYFCSSVYNYAASKYERSQTTQSELSCPTVFSAATKEQFLKGKINLFYKPGSGKRNIVYPENKNLNSSKTLGEFPFYNKLGIHKSVNPKFCNFLKKIEIFDNVLSGYLGYLQGTPDTIAFNVQNDKALQRAVKKPVFDISSWVKDGTVNNIPGFYPLKSSPDKLSGMMNQYKRLLLAGYINKITLGNFRSFEDILQGKESYKEDFVLSVDKFLNSKANKIQSFFLPARNNNSVLNDTQIKYGNKYVYKFDAHYIIIGNKYRYENVKVVKTGGTSRIHLDVINKPSVVIMPIDLFEKSLYAIQPPPMPPEINFAAQNDSTGHIQIYFTSKKGESEGKFSPIFSGDGVQQSILNNNYMDSVTFKEFKESAAFELYISDTPPKRFSDFTKLSEVRMPYISADASFRTKIKPNRSTYYVFRKLNERGFVSNPTPIYEVRLTVDADDSKLSVESYSFPKDILHQDSKRFQSLFQIKPSFEQTLFNDNQPYIATKNTLKGTLDNISLGPAENTVWDRKIKFRFKSTTTGKIIDYNITFKLTKNKTEEEF